MRKTSSKKQKPKTKTKTFLLLKCQQLMCHMDEPARQLNCNGMATQGRASIVDTVPESSHLLHWNCVYSSIYMCTKLCKWKKKKERERENTGTVYTTTHTPRVAHWGCTQEGENVRGLVETPLFIHVYTGCCWIYSQSAISETPSLTYYLQYTEYHIIIFAHVRY